MFGNIASRKRCASSDSEANNTVLVSAAFDRATTFQDSGTPLEVIQTQSPSSFACSSLSPSTMHDDHILDVNTTTPTASTQSTTLSNRRTLLAYCTKTVTADSVTYRCKYCNRVWSYSTELFSKRKQSSGNVMSHVKQVHRAVYKAHKQIVKAGYVGSTTVEVTDFETQLLEDKETATVMIREALENLVMAEAAPFTFVESPHLLRLINLCLNCQNNNIFIPKADAIKNSILNRVEGLKEKMRVDLSFVDVPIHLCLDMWTSSNAYSFLAITAHFINSKWKMEEKLLAFKETTEHAGVSMAELVKATLDDFSITNHLGCLTMDNASNNNTLVQSLAELIEYEDSSAAALWNPTESRIRCFPHILNLAMQAFLNELGYCGNENLDDNDTSKYRALILRIKYLAHKLLNSSKQQKLFEVHCSNHEIPKLMLKMDVRTRWNSTFYMLQRALRLRPAIDSWLESHPVIGKARLGNLQFTDNDWVLLDEVCKLIHRFEKATTKTSAAKYPTLNLVVPLYIELIMFVDNSINSLNEDHELKKPLFAVKKVLQKYFSFTNNSAYYLLSVLLDPRFKKAYFDSRNLDVTYKELVVKAVKILKDEVQRLGRSQTSEVAIALTSQLDEEVDPFDDMYASITNRNAPSDEVDIYMTQERAYKGNDPLDFWKLHEAQFPNLSKVARQVLSIPGSSASVERLFSGGRDLIGIRRHSLKPDTMSALMFGKLALTG